MVPKPVGNSFVRSYPAHASFVANARRDLRAFALSRGASPDAAEDVVFAVAEICATIVDPARRRGAGFLVDARFAGETLTVEITDDATRFGNRTPAHDADKPALAPRGLGMQIVKQLVDQVTFLDGGKSVRLIKRVKLGR